MGDVSVQSSAIGLVPTQAQSIAFISTMCDGNNPPAIGRCNTTTNEHPYSGVSSPRSDVARQFLGLPASNYEFLTSMPLVPGASWNPLEDTFSVPMGGGNSEYGLRGESGAMKTRFFAPQAGVLSFDWNRIGSDFDTAYFSVWSDDPSEPFRLNDWVFDPFAFHGAFSPSGVDLCSRYYDIAPSPSSCGASGSSAYNVETGWSTKTVAISHAGWYWLGFGLGEIAEGTSPTVLALDNVRFQVPEPATPMLVSAALLCIAVSRRRMPAAEAEVYK